MVGQRIGRLTVVELAEAGGDGKGAKWLCECDCGNQTIVDGRNLRTTSSGRVVSCGCYRRELGSRKEGENRHIPDEHISWSGNWPNHGHRIEHTPTYITWSAMRTRCANINNPYYGGRGITVCERWKLFSNFLEDMGERPEGKTLDRIDPNGNYEPSNCRWATEIEQKANRRPYKS